MADEKLTPEQGLFAGTDADREVVVLTRELSCKIEKGPTGMEYVRVWDDPGADARMCLREARAFRDWLNKVLP